MSRPGQLFAVVHPLRYLLLAAALRHAMFSRGWRPRFWPALAAVFPELARGLGS